MAEILLSSQRDGGSGSQYDRFYNMNYPRKSIVKTSSSSWVAWFLFSYMPGKTINPTYGDCDHGEIRKMLYFLLFIYLFQFTLSVRLHSYFQFGKKCVCMSGALNLFSDFIK